MEVKVRISDTHKKHLKVTIVPIIGNSIKYIIKIYFRLFSKHKNIVLYYTYYLRITMFQKVF